MKEHWKHVKVGVILCVSSWGFHRTPHYNRVAYFEISRVRRLSAYVCLAHTQTATSCYHVSQIIKVFQFRIGDDVIAIDLRQLITLHVR